jgi:TonB family protein
MTDNSDPRYFRALGLTFLAGLLVATACQMDQIPTAPPQRSVAAPDGPYFTPMTVRPEIANRREVIETMIRTYPPLLRDNGVGGRALVWFHIDEKGRTIENRLSRTSGNESLDAAALEVASVYRFTPALLRDEPTAVWVQIPMTFEVR